MTVTILVGDIWDRLEDIPDGSIDCLCTSPPYWNQRDYQTATWEGGSSSCDHLAPLPGGHQASGLGAWGTQSQEAIEAKIERRRQHYRGQCPKCGAHSIDAQMGLETTLEEHVTRLVQLFARLRPKLKKHASVWINYGDSWASTPNGTPAEEAAERSADDRTFRDKPVSSIGGQVKPKDLCLIPDRLRLALQADGWWIRGKITWGKPNPMPDSSGRFRPSNAFEEIILMGCSDEVTCWRHADGRWTWSAPAPDYVWINRRTRETSTAEQADAEWFRKNLWEGRDMYYEPAAVAQPVSGSTHARVSQAVEEQRGSARAYGGASPNRPMKAVRNAALKKPAGWAGDGVRHDAIAHNSTDGRSAARRQTKAQQGASRGKDEALRDAPSFTDSRYLRNYEAYCPEVWNVASRAFSEAHFATFPPELAQRMILAGCPIGGTVLDPFGGSCTTALVADRHHRNAIVVELNPGYALMGEARVASDAGPMFNPVKLELPAAITEPEQFDLLDTGAG